MNYCLINDAWGEDSSYCKSLDEKYFTYNSNLNDNNLINNNLINNNLINTVKDNTTENVKDNTTENVKRLTIYEKQSKNMKNFEKQKKQMDELVKVQNKFRGYYKNLLGGENRNLFSTIFSIIDKYMNCFLNFFDKKKTNLDMIYIGLFCIFLLNYKH